MLFTRGKLSIGFVLPFSSHRSVDVDYVRQLGLAQLADKLGFAAVWVRDVPLNSADYPDPIGHIDPWVFLGALAVSCPQINLVTGAIVLPLRHPLHVAKAAASVQNLSSGRFVLGLGSGDRPSEFALFRRDYEQRKETFQENWLTLKQALDGEIERASGSANSSFELYPKNEGHHVPAIIVGSAGQSLEWIARNASGWASYHRDFAVQRDRIALWHSAIEKTKTETFRSFSQSMSLELAEDPTKPTERIELGYRVGRHSLVELLADLQELGVHHVMFNLVGNSRTIEEVLNEIADEILPQFQ